MPKEFKVLSIDGGGMKGIYSARILQELENIIRQKNSNERIVDYFDLICGTSTGGLIALALSQRVPASEIVEFYEQNGSLIFPEFSSQPIVAFLQKTFGRLRKGWIYSNEPLRKALTQMFGEKRIAESECLLCIPSFSLTKGLPWIFKYDHAEGQLTRDNIFKYVDVALATSAAPMYFPKHTLSGYGDFETFQFTDGSVYGNNPSLIGLTEALHYFVGKDKLCDSLALLSIASLNENEAQTPNLPINQTVNIWAPQLSNSIMAGQSFVIDFAVKQICESSILNFNYVRIPSDSVGKEHSPYIQLDASSTDSINLMKGKGYDQGLLYAKKDEVLKFFETPKHYIIKERNPKNG